MIRTFTIALLFIFFACVNTTEKEPSFESYQSNADTSATVIDTSEVVELRGSYFDNFRYRILYGHLVEDRRHIVQLSKENQIFATLLFPISDDEVKNFGINKILETKDGFLIKCDWGGGNYFYNRDFLFKYITDSFYVYQVNYKFFQHDSDNVGGKDSLLTKPINMRSFDPRPFITNE